MVANKCPSIRIQAPQNEKEITGVMLLRVWSIDMIHKSEVVIREVVSNSKGCFMNSFEDRTHKASTSNWITSSINK